MNFWNCVTKFNQACTKYSFKFIWQFPYDPHTWRVAQDFHKATFLHWNYPKTLQKINTTLIGFEKPPHSSLFRFRKNRFFWRQSHFLPTLEVPQKCACNIIRPSWFSLNGIRASTASINNTLLWWPPHFLHLNLSQQSPTSFFASEPLTTISTTSICNFN